MNIYISIQRERETTKRHTHTYVYIYIYIVYIYICVYCRFHEFGILQRGSSRSPFKAPLKGPGVGRRPS